MTTEKPTARDVKGHLDEARRRADLVMPAIWGALDGTATADRWARAAAGLSAAQEALAKAQGTLAGMEKLEPYCDVCREPILRLMAGWSHFRETGGGGVIEADAGHEPELDWRPIREAADDA